VVLFQPVNHTCIYSLCLVSLILTSACAGDPVELQPAEGAAGECMTNEEFFLRELWGPVLSVCSGCHSPQGAARHSDLVLTPETQTGFIPINLQLLEDLSQIEIAGEPILLVKPTGGADHQGGVQLVEGDSGYRTLAEMVRRLRAPAQGCDGSDEQEFAGVVMLDPLQTIRKASIVLVGRLPTDEERDLALSDGEGGAREVVLGMLEEEGFYTWLRTTYNDLLLTDRYLPRNRAVNLLDEEDFPDAHWHEMLEENGADPEEVEAANLWTNRTVAREPLDLIAHVVRNDRPFTDILTADYRLFNPYSARVYGADQSDFDDLTDPSEFLESDVADLPTAGVLTSPMFLNRFPTTATNRNRQRSRVVYDLFLATDLLRLGERPIDSDQIEDFNPTLYNPACTVCHTQLDPVAGAFQNWDSAGRYRPLDDGWFPDMLPPGFDGQTVPTGRNARSVPWLAQQIARDERFAMAAVHTMYRGLTGREPLSVPSDPEAEGYDTALAAFESQNETFLAIVDAFIADNYNLKTAIAELIMTPYFRTVGLDASAEGREEELAALGTGRMLTPEMLNRKILAVTGFPWKRGWDRADYLLSDYLIFYGGIDSDTVIHRIGEPNGLTTGVSQRMAAQMACLVVPQEFAAPAEDRVLLPLVEPTYEPEDINGFPVDRAEIAIRANIHYLHEHVLGELLPYSDAELDRTYDLFYETWQEGIEGIASGEYSTWLNWQCRAANDYWTAEEYPEEQQVLQDPNYTIRAWMAVMTYMLSDYKFLYE